jgi:Na+-transporting NADH:ubiquinone oxidoreductase subunit NqrA
LDNTASGTNAKTIHDYNASFDLTLVFDKNQIQKEMVGWMEPPLEIPLIFCDVVGCFTHKNCFTHTVIPTSAE